MKLPLNTDLTGKVAVVTGAGGVLCSMFSRALAAAGAKVAMLDINEEAVTNFAASIREEGYTAKGYRCDVLDKASLEAVHEAVLKDFGPCDILLNGAGGNNARANTDLEHYNPGDLEREVKTFFDLEQPGVEGSSGSTSSAPSSPPRSSARTWSSGKAATSSTSPR